MKAGFTISSLKRNGRVWMAPFAFSIKKEGKDSAISCEGDGHSLL